MGNSAHNSETMKILFIEGHPHVRKPLEHILLSRGHDVTAVDSGEEGLRAIANARYDAVVCNHQLPGISGIDFFSRSQRILSGATTILTAAFAGDYLANNALAMGISVFIEMPFKIDHLLACVEGRYPDIHVGSLGCHLYITSGGQMMAICPTRCNDRTVAAIGQDAPPPKTINLPGRRWKLYLNPGTTPGPSLHNNGSGPLQKLKRNRQHTE